MFPDKGCESVGDAPFFKNIIIYFLLFFEFKILKKLPKVLKVLQLAVLSEY